MVELEKYKQVARDIAKIFEDGYLHPLSGNIEPYQPVEFEAGLTFAIALYLVAQFKGELEEAYKRHGDNLRAFMEELDAKSHPDDMIDITGLKL